MIIYGSKPYERMIFIILIIVLFLLITNVACNQLFYIYDLSQRFVDTWPPNILNKSNNHSIFSNHFKENHGFGTIIDGDYGIFNSWQFSVFKMIHIRLINHPLRTLDPHKASIFFIPYDGGVDALVSSYDGRLIKSKCPRSGHVKNFIQNQDSFKLFNGSRHFMIFSVIQGVSSLNSPGCKVLYREVCKYCIKLTIEVSYHKESNGSSKLIHKKYKNSAFQYDPTWISIPYPSSFHYWQNSKIIPWNVNVNSNHRNIFVTFVGGGKTINYISKSLREKLKYDCSKYENCLWKDTGRERSRVNLSEALHLYRRSIFCLSPPGDSPTRKGIFDSLLAGCIPVVFDPFTLADQYPWHIGPDNLNNISIYIPTSDIIGNSSLLNNSNRKRKNHSNKKQLHDVYGRNFYQMLMKISPNRIREMQFAIEKIGWSLQYSLPPVGILEKTDEKKNNIKSIWSPPQPDSVDVIISKLFKLYE